MNILVRLPNWFGDTVMSFGFLDKISGIFTDCTIDVIAAYEFCDLVRLFPSISRVYPFSKKEHGSLMGIMNFAGSIRRQKTYDIFFALPDSFSSACTGFFCGAKQRIGYNKEMRFFLLTTSFPKPRGHHRAEEYAYLLKEYTENPCASLQLSLPYTVSEERILAMKQAFAFFDEPYILFNGNSAASSRRLPIKKSVLLIDTLLKQFQVPIVLTGSAKEHSYTENIRQQTCSPESVINTAGKCCWETLIMLCKKSLVVISADSGLAHLANSVGSSCIVFFGAGKEENTAPYIKNNLYVVRAPGITCAPCISNTCAFGVPLCLESIDEQEIVEIVQRIAS